jgi:hypothetical protein
MKSASDEAKALNTVLLRACLRLRLPHPLHFPRLPSLPATPYRKVLFHTELSGTVPVDGGRKKEGTVRATGKPSPAPQRMKDLIYIEMRLLANLLLPSPVL